MEHYKIYSDHLSHHGIKGQKWGRRRWQNEDGTLTKAGKERYYGESDSRDTAQTDEEMINATKSYNAYNNYVKAQKQYNENQKLENESEDDKKLRELKEDNERFNIQQQYKRNHAPENELIEKTNALNATSNYYEAQKRHDKIVKEQAPKPATVKFQEGFTEAAKNLRDSSSSGMYLGQKKDAKINAAAQQKAYNTVSKMTDEEIRNKCNRLDLENRYVRTVAPDTHKYENKYRDILMTASSLFGIAATGLTIYNLIKHK